MTYKEATAIPMKTAPTVLSSVGFCKLGAIIKTKERVYGEKAANERMKKDTITPT
jgi:hypothetical protein